MRAGADTSWFAAPFAFALAFAAAPGAEAQSPSSEGAQSLRWDIAVAIDVSESTRAASGIDVDGDGVVGINPTLDPRLDGQYPEGLVSTDPEDSILAAELAAVRALLATLDGGAARVAIVSFSGAIDPATGKQAGAPADNAQLRAPLSDTLEDAVAALDEIARLGSHGGTDFSAAIRTARHALCGADARPDASRVLLLLTDGLPSLPQGFATRTDRGDVSGAIEAAREASACGVRIDVFAIGILATSDPFAAKEITRVSGGRYHPIDGAADLRAALERAFDTFDVHGGASRERP
jgi:hypothetical protein